MPGVDLRHNGSIYMIIFKCFSFAGLLTLEMQLIQVGYSETLSALGLLLCLSLTDAIGHF